MYSIGKSLHVNPFWELKGYDLETDSLKIVWIVDHEQCLLFPTKSKYIGCGTLKIPRNTGNKTNDV